MSKLTMASITVLGEAGGVGNQEIDAQGLTVTPGFVDLRTHLDVYIGWDPSKTTVSGYGCHQRVDRQQSRDGRTGATCRLSARR